MYFKRLEMFGFKSFADRTKIEFEKGITAIVGPNGCGKSNIADAVKWVLGEQSAKSLRGSCMEDIIFNGTESRESLGYAEVSLTLSNEKKFLPIEYDEVTISRRLYRSGESEYLMNKNPVRLKDINELLMGSGLGTSAYSMIEQGRIDQILSANPDQRRIVFEEASGITKYKSKKREAIRRLEYTEQNLLRVNDIIKEVERQIRSIERQAKKANRYQELFNRLKELDTKLAAYKYRQMKERQDSLGNQKTNLEDTLSRFHIETTELVNEIEDLVRRQDELDEKLHRYRLEQNNTDMSIQRNTDKILLDRERLQELYKYQIEQENEIASLDTRKTDIEKGLGDITQKLTSISDECKRKEDLFISKKEELSTLKDEIVKNEESVKQNKSKLIDILAILSKLRNEIARVASDMQNISARLRRLTLEKEKVLKEKSALEKDLTNARLAVNMTMSKIEGLETERVTFQNNLKKEREEFSSLEKEINNSKNDIFSLHSKLSFLKDLVRRHEGFTAATQALLNKLQEKRLDLGGRCGPLAEMLEPKKGYEAACEAALMENIQMLVVDNWNVAFSAINFLVDNKLGKASFVKNISIQTQLQEDREIIIDNPLVLGKVIDFMEIDPQYSLLFKYILKNTFLVKDIKDGISVMESLLPEVRRYAKFVTRNGDIITENTITGGSTSQDFTSSIIGRQKRIKETKEDIAKAEENLLVLKQKQSVKKELIEDYLSRIRNIEETLRSEEIELAQKKSAEENLEKMFKKIKEEIELIEIEIEEAMLNKSELNDKQVELKSNLDKKMHEETELQNAITVSQIFIEKGLKRKEELLVGLTQIETELSSLKREEDNLLKTAQAQKNYYNQQLNLLNTKRHSLEESHRKQKELKDEIEKLELDIKRLNQRAQIIEGELKLLQSEFTQLKDIIKEKKEVLDEKRKKLATLKDRVHNISMEETQLSFQMSTLRNRIDEVYKINIDDVLHILPEEKDLQYIEAEVEQLRQNLDRFGPVNLVAIEEHKELQERYSFLKRQQEDLTAAKESLHKAIGKINQTTKSLFMETFTNIQNEFKNYFRFLFGGGRAEIVLLDEKDVLESGIEIIVRPPGKKLQTISLLSGGEKALTAIALLFAIFKVKPSPFCLLDEIDAPLDESNIGRFIKVLQEFTKTSQFIIISHNKKTIEISDVMYGITMEQSGISKVISVKFAKKENRYEKVLI